MSPHVISGDGPMEYDTIDSAPSKGSIYLSSVFLAGAGFLSTISPTFLAVIDLSSGLNARMQFTQMSEAERQKVKEGLLRYCELDTLAMVMIYEYWNEIIKS
jgi:hypothetical protein